MVDGDVDWGNEQVPEEPGVVEDEEDFLSGVVCNPGAPEECESCQ